MEKGPSAAACLEISAEAHRATLIIHGDRLGGGPVPSRMEVEGRLEALKVVHGLDSGQLDRILAENLFDRTHVIAVATPAKEGRRAWIEEVIKWDVDTRPQVLSDGSADYKNVDNIRRVKEGEVLAVKHPPVLGEPGRDVFGNPILPQPPEEDAEFNPGPNTVVSEDGLRLVAAKGGFFYHYNGQTCVGETYVVRGNVGYKTGNIRYQGNILIKGSVSCGFTVEADGDVTVEGGVEAGHIISKGGSVEIQQAFFGQGKGRIRAGKDIRVGYVQDAFLECGGVLEVGKGLRNCQASAGKVSAGKPGCSLIGGLIKSYSDIAVAALGAAGSRTEIQLADKEAEAAQLRLREIEKQKQSILPKIQGAENKLKDMVSGACQSGKPVQQMQAAINEIMGALGKAKKVVASLDQSRLEVEWRVRSCASHTGKVSITEAIVERAKLNLYGMLRDLGPEDAKKAWTWSPGEPESRPLSLL